MSDTKTQAKAPKQGTVAAAHQRIAELEAIVRKMEATPHNCPAQLPRLNHYQITGRVNLPGYGQALPAGVCFHGYVSVRLEDELLDGRAVAPDEDEVMTLLTQKAAEQFPGFVSVELADVSLLPAGW